MSRRRDSRPSTCRPASAGCRYSSRRPIWLLRPGRASPPSRRPSFTAELRDPRRQRPPSGEILLAVLALGPGTDGVLFGVAQLDPADLAADRLRQLGELQPADALVRREVAPAEREDVA